MARCIVKCLVCDNWYNIEYTQILMRTCGTICADSLSSDMLFLLLCLLPLSDFVALLLPQFSLILPCIRVLLPDSGVYCRFVAIIKQIFFGNKNPSSTIIFTVSHFVIQKATICSRWDFDFGLRTVAMLGNTIVLHFYRVIL